MAHEYGKFPDGANQVRPVAVGGWIASRPGLDPVRLVPALSPRSPGLHGVCEVTVFTGDDPNMKMWFLPLSLLLTAGMATAAAVTPPRPNILVILADDLGFSDVGCYGGEIATPNLDRLAAAGLRFSQMYNATRCWPSRAALLTGYHAHQVRRDQVPGITSGAAGRRPVWAPLFPEFLRQLGYRCYHSGKWHVDGKPLENGFDRSFEINSRAENNYFRAEGLVADGVPVKQTENFYLTTAITDHALHCLREHDEHHLDRPFFHYVAFTAPHFPLQAPAADIARYADRYHVGWNFIAAQRHARLGKMGLPRHPLPAMEAVVGPPYHFPEALERLGPGEINRPLPWTELTATQRVFQATKMAIHAAMVDRMDREIGRVLEQLRQMGAWENTLIMFASDNGASAEIMVRGLGHDPGAPPGSERSYLCLGPGWSSAANTPFRRHKTWVHEGGIATPFIVHWPAGLRARGQWRHTPAHFIDLVPTWLELTGATRPAEIQGRAVPPLPGRSLVSVFRRDSKRFHETLWWLHEGNAALRAGDWKLVKDNKGDWELYDLKRDRGETRNLATRHAEKARELRARWEAEREEIQRLARTD